VLNTIGRGGHDKEGITARWDAHKLSSWVRSPLGTWPQPPCERRMTAAEATPTLIRRSEPAFGAR